MYNFMEIVYPGTVIKGIFYALTKKNPFSSPIEFKFM